MISGSQMARQSIHTKAVEGFVGLPGEVKMAVLLTINGHSQLRSPYM